MMPKSVWVLSAVGAVLAGATAVAIRATATEATAAISPLVVTGVVLLIGFLFIGSSRWIGISSAPMVGAIAVEAGFSDDPSWTRSILIGCLWFVTMEVSWEAIERRTGARHTRAANERRVQEVITVLVIALVLGLVATAATVVAPVRSVFLQALVLGALLAAFVALVRAATIGRRREPSN